MQQKTGFARSSIFLVFLALTACGGGGSNPPGSTPSAPSPPTNVTAAAGNAQVTIRWDSVSGASSYDLYRATAAGVTKANYASLPGGTKRENVASPLVQTSLTNGTAYHFVVTALNSGGESAESSEVSATPSGGAGGTSPGTLDATFDGDGKVTTPIGSGADEIHALALQADGKIVVAGYAWNGSNDDFALARYNTNGTLDTTFGAGGKVVTPIGASNDQANALALQADGKMVVAGYSASGFGGSPGLNWDFALARYNTNGTLDTAFGTGGKVVTAISGCNLASCGDDVAHAVAIQSDGKIVAAGYYTDVATPLVWHIALVRYNTNGTLDTAFGSGGKVTTAVRDEDIAHAVAIQPDGKIVVAGESASLGDYSDFALVRYNANGTLDTTFGTGGKVTTANAGQDIAFALKLQQVGTETKIVVAGGTASATFLIEPAQFTLARYNANGTLDTAFGTGGKTITPIGGKDTSQAIALQADGKIVAAGYSAVSLGPDFDFAVARYNANGSQDTTFGSSGKVTTSFGTDDDRAFAVAVQADGKIVAAGYSGSSSAAGTRNFVLARYLP